MCALYLPEINVLCIDIKTRIISCLQNTKGFMKLGILLNSVKETNVVGLFQVTYS